jgi:hypothetical protein
VDAPHYSIGAKRFRAGLIANDVLQYLLVEAEIITTLRSLAFSFSSAIKRSAGKNSRNYLVQGVALEADKAEQEHSSSGRKLQVPITVP